MRPGGSLAFLCHSYVSMLTFPEVEDAPASETLQRPHFGMHRFDWEDGDGIEFAIPHGEMIRLLRGSGFEVVDLVELRAPDDAVTPEGFVLATAEWSRRWPIEENLGGAEALTGPGQPARSSTTTGIVRDPWVFSAYSPNCGRTATCRA